MPQCYLSNDVFSSFKDQQIPRKAIPFLVSGVSEQEDQTAETRNHLKGEKKLLNRLGGGEDAIVTKK